jgi:hypothetical protein
VQSLQRQGARNVVTIRPTGGEKVMDCPIFIFIRNLDEAYSLEMLVSTDINTRFHNPKVLNVKAE